MAENEFAYEHGTLSADDLNTEIALFWRTYDGGDEGIRSRIEAANVEITALDSANRDTVIQARTQGAGIGVETVAIIVAFAPLVNRVAGDLWAKVLLPWIVSRRGLDAVGKKKSK